MKYKKFHIAEIEDLIKLVLLIYFWSKSKARAIMLN